MSKSQITIQVSGSPPQVAGTRKFSWSSAGTIESDPAQRGLSRQIFGYESVLAILRQAFVEGLHRGTVWDTSQVDQYLRPSYEVAARVYKRGVPIDGVNREIGTSSYSISFHADLIETFATFSAKALFIIDAEVARYWWAHLPGGFVAIDCSEAKKDIQTLADVITVLREHEEDFRDVVVVGGGVAGDMVGFACGLVGRRFHFVPTTLLSIVDSSIGGKVGVNFEPWGKNQLGLFSNPASVQVWSGWLSTLNAPEIKSGLAEALKHALLRGNKDLWSQLINISNNDKWNLLGDLLHEVISFKADVVMRDPYEAGERSILNFGHTLGHAVETLAARHGLHVTHGACIALGMIHALRVSEKRLGFDSSQLVRDLLDADILPAKSILSEILKLPLDDFINLMISDKKIVGGESGINFVLLSASGDVARGSNGQWVIHISTNDARDDIKETFDFLASQYS